MVWRPHSKPTRTYNTRLNKKKEHISLNKKSTSIREEVTTLQGELKRLSTLVASLVVSQNQPQFQQGPERQHQQQPRQQASKIQFDPILMTYAELLPILLQENLVKTSRSTRPWHRALSLFEDWSPKADWSQYLAFLRMNPNGQMWSTPGLCYPVLWHIECIAAIGLLLMFLLLLICSNNAFVCLLLFKISFCPARDESKLV